ncbi:MAG: radical SAM family heme chaperone HemW [Flavobacteriales bacterium]|nr:radical SAM family heme chaperone HemW [Flavobacteriales bacterium]
MSSIYVHIPFCKQACTYCDFHFSTNQTLRGKLVDALCREIHMRSAEVDGPIQTLYFGGGSPSILNAEELSKIFDALTQAFNLTQLQETTLESNPDDHSGENLKLWRSLGIDRLSIGIQSFIERDLRLMNRAHDVSQAETCVRSAREAGFNSLTIDLIYGIPGQSMLEWQGNVQKALALQPDHISAYCLTVEERTALHHLVENGKVIEKEDTVIEDEYLYLHQALETAGWRHYEISNFGVAGKEAVHNSNYWSGQSYLGFGPAAHSFDGQSKRRWNVSNNAVYIRSIEQGVAYWESEVLSERDRSNELLMTGLRRADGVDLNLLPPAHRKAILSSVESLTGGLLESLQVEGAVITMDATKWLMADAVIRALMIA